VISAPVAIYPQEAIDAHLEGWVEVEFTVDRAGQTRDAVVVDARPRSRFSAAALAAVAQYRYEPFELDGRRYERRVRVRMRFVLP
jgi:protein TonB